MTVPVYQQTQVATASGAVSGVTLSSFAVGSGSNRSLTAFFGWRDDTASALPTGSSIVFNGSEGFTYKGRRYFNFGGDNYCVIEAWYLDNPTNTTADIVATASELNDSGDGMFLIVVELTNANNGVGTFGSGQSLDTAPTVTMTTTDGNSLVIWGIIGQATVGTSFTPGTGTTERADGNVGEVAYFAGDEAATGGSDTFDATWSISSRWAAVAVEVLPEAAGGVTVTPSPVSSIAAVVAPAIVLGSLALTPATIDGVAATVDPAVVLGDVAITPTSVAAIGLTVDPVVISGGDVVVTPSPSEAVAALVNPVIVLGSLALTPTAIDTVAVTIDPSIILGGLALTPAQASGVAVTIDPAVVMSSLAITPTSVAAIGLTVDPTVSTETFTAILDYILPARSFAYALEDERLSRELPVRSFAYELDDDR